MSLSSQKYGFGIRDPEKTYSGSRIQGSKRHRIPDPDPQHWLIPCVKGTQSHTNVRVSCLPFCARWPRAPAARSPSFPTAGQGTAQESYHGLMNYNDTKAKCRQDTARDSTIVSYRAGHSSEGVTMD